MILVMNGNQKEQMQQVPLMENVLKVLLEEVAAIKLVVLGILWIKQVVLVIVLVVVQVVIP